MNNDWIKVEDRLPEYTELEVLVAYSGRGQRMGFMKASTLHQAMRPGSVTDVTHWMEAPVHPALQIDLSRLS